MPFVNEHIPHTEYQARGLGEIDKRYTPMSSVSSDWTIDRERDIHMRQVSRTVPTDMGPHTPFFLLWWKSAYVVFACAILQFANKHNGWHGHKRLTRLEIPDDLLPYRSEIVADIESALLVYGTGGVYCKAENFSLTFDIAQELQ
jgi:hypothetical protein